MSTVIKKSLRKFYHILKMNIALYENRYGNARRDVKLHS